ncbi:hypothetical protein GCM10011494_03850 [Novosphingobium endophyticum]|uniref:Uncharacterized protein n=1 Tax=Novosphingobium endophyticum TaxID=1955250 RepID=A0A916X348_9SPHN|nr:hypothetical protein [Novosphingobium endophyticum]GGB88777.1 hypothetical protein GCM10011494_03850 [Novosphingobium endophyticum]
MTAGLAPANAQSPVFSESGAISSTTGHAVLSWQAEEPVVLSIAHEPDLSDARPLYRGDERSYFLSGLADGDYYLRLENESGEASAPLRLSVTHQSLAQALWLTAIGLVITLAVVATILRGARDD